MLRRNTIRESGLATRDMRMFSILGVIALVCASQAAAQATDPDSVNHVLDLDGMDSWVELPSDLFTNQVVTVEGWVKWREFAPYSRFFQFADSSLHIAVYNYQDTDELTGELYLSPPFDDLHTGGMPNAIRQGEWEHVAMVAGPDWARLYLNGMLIRSDWEPLGYPMKAIRSCFCPGSSGIHSWGDSSLKTIIPFSGRRARFFRCTPRDLPLLTSPAVCSAFFTHS